MTTPLQKLIIEVDVEEDDWSWTIIQAIGDPEKRGYLDAHLEQILDAYGREDAQWELLHLVEQIEETHGPVPLRAEPGGPHSGSFQLVGPSILDVRVESTGPEGGDAGHGGFTRLELKSTANFYMDATVDLGLTGTVSKRPGEVLMVELPEVVTLTVHGDSEMRQLREALRRILLVLEG